MLDWLKRLRPYTVPLGRVRDEVKFTDGGEPLRLSVNADPARMVLALNAAKEKLNGITENSTSEDLNHAAMALASAIFGDEQAIRLVDYAGDPACVMTACNRYFKERLAGLIERAQKRAAK